MISSLIADYLEKENSADILIELDMESFKVKALAPERTFCEKILALRRASHKDSNFFGARIRHVYDLHQLYHSKRIQKFILDTNSFKEVLTKCYVDDESNIKLTAEIGGAFTKSKIFSTPKEKIEEVKTQYENLKNITFNNSLPRLDEVSTTLNSIGRVLKDYSF